MALACPLFFGRTSQSSNAVNTNATALNPTNLTAVPMLGALPYLIDPRFSILTQFDDIGSQRGLDLSCLLYNAVEAMSKLAVQSYNGHIVNSTLVFGHGQIKIGGDGPMSRCFGI